MSTKYALNVVLTLQFLLPGAVLASAWPDASSMGGIASVALLLISAGLGGWWARDWRERSITRSLFVEMRRAGEGVPEMTDAGDAACTTQAALRHLFRALAAEREKAETQMAVRQRIEQDLRASEERYALALKGADEGWWEWNLKSGRVMYSERWCCMLGLTPAHLGDGIDEWCRRIHPADRERAQSELEAHLNGLTPRFENEHRVLHQDGEYRWVLARATALRHAGGRPERLVGLATDVTARKQVQQAVMDLADGLVSVRGEVGLRSLVKCFAKVLGVREVFVCECLDFPTTRVRMLARWNRGGYDRCVDFPLEGTACADVILSGRLVYEPDEAGRRWPVEMQYERNSYLGLPCIDSQGAVLGHIACADPGAMPDLLPHEALLRIFAVRAAIELEWRALERLRESRAAFPTANAALLQ